MTAWADRAQVPAVMLNPALLATLLSESARGYCSQARAEAMPLALSFVVLPMVLHRPTRQVLPRNTRTYLTIWLGRHPVLRAGFPLRAASLVENTQEALRFGARNGLLAVNGRGVAASARTGSVEDGVTRELVKAARLVGRWCAASGTVATVYQALGVRP